MRIVPTGQFADAANAVFSGMVAYGNGKTMRLRILRRAGLTVQGMALLGKHEFMRERLDSLQARQIRELLEL